MTQAVLLLAALGALGQPDTSPNSSAELLSESTTIVPGQPFWVGFKIKLDPHWHTYWKNPGDSGIAPDIQFTLGSTKLPAKLEYPCPTALLADGMTIYGYENEVTFLARLTPPKNLPVGKPVRLTAKGQWLICKETCLNATETKSLMLDVGKAAKPGPVKAQLMYSVGQIPKVQPGWSFSAMFTAKGYDLLARGPGATDVSKGQFFADMDQVIDHSAKQIWNAGKLFLPKSPYSQKVPTRLTGLFVAPPGVSWAPNVQGVVVNIPVQK